MIPLFVKAFAAAFSRGMLTTKGIATQDVAHISILKIENPNAADSIFAREPFEAKVRNIDTRTEAMKHMGAALRQ